MGKQEREGEGRAHTHPGYLTCIRKGDRRGDVVRDVCAPVPQDDGADQPQDAG